MKHKKIIAVFLICITLLTAAFCSANAATQIGDVNADGKINVMDATLIQKKLCGVKTNEKYYGQYADFDRSGNINITDATLIQQYSSGSVVTYGNYFLSLNNNNTASVYKYFGKNINSLTIPTRLNSQNRDITKISAYAFNNHSELTAVTLPKSITNIDSNAFYNCSELKTVYSYNDSLVWGNSFVNCPKFQSIIFK